MGRYKFHVTSLYGDDSRAFVIFAEFESAKDAFSAGHLLLDTLRQVDINTAELNVYRPDGRCLAFLEESEEIKNDNQYLERNVKIYLPDCGNHSGRTATRTNSAGLLPRPPNGTRSSEKEDAAPGFGRT
jgi:hypothetical protein